MGGILQFEVISMVVFAIFERVKENKYMVPCLERIKEMMFHYMLIGNTYIADIDCLISCGELDNENAEVRKARSLFFTIHLQYSLFIVFVSYYWSSNTMTYICNCLQEAEDTNCKGGLHWRMH